MSAKLTERQYQECPQCSNEGVLIGQDEFSMLDDNTETEFYCPTCNIKYNNQKQTKTPMPTDYSIFIKLIDFIERKTTRKFQVTGALVLLSGLGAVLLTELSFFFLVFGIFFMVLGGYLIFG
jgi:hypothetical protein